MIANANEAPAYCGEKGHTASEIPFFAGFISSYGAPNRLQFLRNRGIQVEILKLIGVVIVIVGFLIKWDTIATVVLAGIVTGMVSGMSFMEILDVLGSAFITQRTATLFVLTLPVIGICERYGLKDKAVDFIHKAKKITAGKIISIYMVIRSAAAIMSLQLGGHPQFIRPLIEPMANAAATTEFGPLKEKTTDKIKGFAASAENYGNFFAQNCFMGSPGVLLIVSTLVEQGQEVTPPQIVMMSIPIAVAALIVSFTHYYLLDRSLRKEYAPVNAAKVTASGREGEK